MIQLPEASAEESRRSDLRAAFTLGILLLAAVIGVLLVFRFVDEERARELRAWQVRLGIVADSRASEVDKWMARQRDELTTLADNPTIQLFVTELTLAGGDLSGVTEADAQLEYLQNLLIITADQNGFTAPLFGPDVPVNVPHEVPAGLALLDSQGRLLAATKGFSPPPLPAASDAPLGGPFTDLSLDASGAPSLTIAAPIYRLQTNPEDGEEVGTLVGVKQIAGELYPLLQQPGALEQSLETLLLRPADATVEYLSPLADGTPPLTRRLARDTPNLAAAFALEQDGGFAIRRDYRDVEVLVTSRQLNAMPWTVAVKIDRAEALADSETRLSRLLIVLLLAIGLSAVAVLAVWRHGASRRADRAARLFRDTAEALEQQRNLLRLVTDSQPTSIFIVDDEGQVRFANKVTAEQHGVSGEDLVGKSLPAVFGPAAAKRTLDLNRDALDKGGVLSDTARLNGAGPERIFISEHIPIRVNGAPPKSVLVVERDITAEVTERERRERTLHHLVRALVGVVDRRDPHAAEHSQRVGRLARAIAQEMGLDRAACEAPRFAGQLMNFGKILVPQSLLTRSGSLSDAERRQVQEGLAATADLLSGVEFPGPVVEILRQAQEHVDGSGPNHLVGDDILLGARIIAAANAFVGMVSPRAHRAPLSVEAAEAELLQQVGKVFDRGVVAALINHLDNRNGRAEWQPSAPPPA